MTTHIIKSSKSDMIIVKARPNHADQWVHLKRLFVGRRGSDAGQFKKAIPRTTNRDVAQLVDYWHGEFRRVEVRGFPALDTDRSSRERWRDAKVKIDWQLAAADPAALYAENEWFWQDATGRLAIYLESLKVVPSRTELALEAVTETAVEHGQRIKQAAETGALGALEVLKTGALIAGAALGALVVIPAIIRALRE